jgi:hypothetical protein
MIDFDEEFRAMVLQLPHRRYRHACAMLARQEAFKIAGPDWQDYFYLNRAKLIEEAKEVIATHQAWAKYRRR